MDSCGIIISMSETSGGGNDFWLNPEVPPPPKKTVGGFLKNVIALLRPSETSPQNLEEMMGMKGVDTNLVEHDGKQRIEVSVNTMVLPRKGKK